METLHNRDEHIRQMDRIAHKLLLIGRVIRLGCEKAIDHFFGEEDKLFLKELENRDLYQVKEELLKQLQRGSRHNYSAFEC